MWKTMTVFDLLTEFITLIYDISDIAHRANKVQFVSYLLNI